jgi:uncharacterized membrane protein YqjE
VVLLRLIMLGGVLGLCVLSACSFGNLSFVDGNVLAMATVLVVELAGCSWTGLESRESMAALECAALRKRAAPVPQTA